MRLRDTIRPMLIAPFGAVFFAFAVQITAVVIGKQPAFSDGPPYDSPLEYWPVVALYVYIFSLVAGVIGAGPGFVFFPPARLPPIPLAMIWGAMTGAVAAVIVFRNPQTGYLDTFFMWAYGAAGALSGLLYRIVADRTVARRE